MVKIHESRPAASATQVADAEAKLQVKLPDDYRAFLMKTNGGYPEPDGFVVAWQPAQAPAPDWRTSKLSRFYAITEERTSNLLRANMVTFARRLPAQTIAIAIDAGGNQLLLALGGPLAGKVLFWVKDLEAQDDAAPGYDNVGIVADSFTDLLQQRLR
jgi:cell wall assembly regulator SMI1